MRRRAPGAGSVAALARLLLALLLATARAPAAAAGPVEIGGELESYGVVRFDHGSPSQDPLARVRLRAAQRVTDGLRWQLSAIGSWGGPPKSPSAGVFEYDRTYQNLSPSLQLGETFLEIGDPRVEVRIGLLEFNWGRLDAFSPLDVLSPRQYEDPLVEALRDQKIAVPAVSWSLFFADDETPLPGDVRLTLVWQPIDVPWRFPLLGERWYPPAGRTRSTFTFDGVTLDVTQRTRNAPPPARRFDNGNVGVRLAVSGGAVDWALTFIDGFDTQPSFAVPIRLRFPAGAPLPVVDTEIMPAYRRVVTVGADFELTWEGLAMRGEVAWRARQPQPRDLREVGESVARDPRSVAALLRGETVTAPAFFPRDTFTWGLGVDHPIGDAVAVLQVVQQVLAHNDEPLLVKNVDTQLVASIRKPLLAERAEVEVGGLWAIESGAQLARGVVRYDLRDDLELWLGVIAIWGRSPSIIGQFKRNDQAVAGVTYRF